MKNGMKQTEIGEIPAEWEVVKLGETGAIISGATPDTKVAEYWDGEIAWCTPTDITALKGKPYISNTQKRISETGLRKSSATLLPVGSLVICTRATLGDCAINLIPITTNQGFKSIVPNKKWDVSFLYHLINNSKDLIRRLSSGSTFLEISKRAFENIDIVAPPLPEQRKIAEILSTLDEKMAVMDEQLAQTQELKKGLMQRLLTKGVGHTQFKDSPLGEIPASWEVKEMNEVTSYVDYRGKTPPKVDSGVFLVTAKNVRAGKIDYSLSQEYVPAELYDSIMSRGKPAIGDVLITTEAPLGEVASIDREDIALAQRVIKYRAIPSVLNGAYFKYALLSPQFQEALDKESTGSTVKGIKGSRLHKMKLLIPKSLPEQSQIAEILTTVDEKIGVLQDKKAQVQALKRGLMQQLLTGQRRVRVVESIAA